MIEEISGGNDYPEFDLSWGWAPRLNVLNDALTDAALNGTSTLRPQGLQEGAVTFDVTSALGASLTFFVEGSNDGGTNWHVIAQTPASAPTTTAITVTIGTTGTVSLARWERIRFRAADSLGGTFTCAARLSGCPKPGSSSTATRSTNVVRNADPTLGAVFNRLGGSQFATIQVVLASITANSVDVTLEGSTDGGSTFVTISDASTFSGAGSAVMTQGGSSVIDLGGFTTLRVVGTDVGATVAYDFTAFVMMDSTEWLLNHPEGDSGGGGSLTEEQNCILDLVSVGAEALSRRLTTWQLLKQDGTPLLEARTVAFVAGDTTNAGDFDLATNATIVAAGLVGTLVAGTGTNAVLITTDTTGTCAFNTENLVGTETNFVTGGTGRVYNKSVPFQIVQSDEASCAYA